MSYLVSPGEQQSIFGQGGGQQLAKELQADLLSQIPLVPQICAGGDFGIPVAISAERNSEGTAAPNSPASQTFAQIAMGLNATFQAAQPAIANLANTTR